jgi:DNA repair and recombination protein RAD52
MFSEEQKAALTAKLDPSVISNREQGGKKLSYIEGWWAIAEANRIFGFDAWNRETIVLQETSRDLVKVKGYNGKPDYDQWRVSYLARVRITIGAIVREGTGYGSGMSKPEALGDAIESAAKEAETDAMKRALMTFGNPFGLALYDKTHANVGREEVETPRQSSAQLKRDDAWNKLMFKLSADFGDCKSLVTLSKLRADYREMARKEGWPKAWLEALGNEFDTFEQSLQQNDEALTAAADQAVKQNAYAASMRAG